MADGYPQPVFLDATVISNYASTDSVEFLVRLLESPVVSPQFVTKSSKGEPPATRI